ncbi:hypothetical protein F4861DRAFT_537328 [Xylaria intraflava]|nr:hypothetical protein F4861DRAFT_537328 [Xylaria intraflava]
MSGGNLKQVISPECDVSPGRQPTSKDNNTATQAAIVAGDEGRSTRTSEDGTKQHVNFDVRKQAGETDKTSSASTATTGETSSTSGSSASNSRKGSLANVTFRPPDNPSLPQGLKKPHGGSRIRDASPPYRKFESHVAFDNIPLGDSTSCNPISFTLNVRHAGFQFNRRHRTFMVGVDDNSYSDHALQWVLDELIDDGDEIVCVRVIETQVRLTDKTYQDDAKVLMESIQLKNNQNRAISLILEYAVGKLHNTFQHLIKIYQPSMLIVGTKGRNMDGVHGFLVNRSSFSKYCLQYSPVPVVVVRPTEKREKKKAKRAGDPSRQSYMQILGGQRHEVDEISSAYKFEPNITADEEAHRVAVAVGLPAAYDPTIKPVDPMSLLRKSSRQPPKIRTNVTATAEKKPGEDSESEDEEEFEVHPGTDFLKKEKLQKMEKNEGAALRAETSKGSTGSLDSDEDVPSSGGTKT